MQLRPDFNPKDFVVLATKEDGTPIGLWRDSFRGTENISIREMWKDDNGRWGPTKKGVTFPLFELGAATQQFNDFVDTVMALEKANRALKAKLAAVS